MTVEWFPACLVWNGRRYRAEWSVEYGLIWYCPSGVGAYYLRDRTP